MGAISFALPYTAETVAKGYDFIAQLTGERSDEHHHRHKLHGLQNFKIWRQHHPVEVVIVYLEADDIETMLESRRKADHEFEQWFDEQVVGITGYHWADAKGELLMRTTRKATGTTPGQAPPRRCRRQECEPVLW